MKAADEADKDKQSKPQEPAKPFPPPKKHSQPIWSQPKGSGREGPGAGRQAYTLRVSRRSRHHHKPGK